MRFPFAHLPSVSPLHSHTSGARERCSTLAHVPTTPDFGMGSVASKLSTVRQATLASHTNLEGLKLLEELASIAPAILPTWPSFKPDLFHVERISRHKIDTVDLLATWANCLRLAVLFF